MTIDDTQKNNIDNNFKELMDKFHALSTFAEVQSWRKLAGNGIEQISGIIRALNLETAQQTQTLERIKYEASKKLVGRLFGGSNEEKELTQQIEKYRQFKSDLESMVIQMQEALDFTPGSPDQQKELLKELRLRKKEIQEKKREITTVIRPARGIAQAQTEQPAVFDSATVDRRKARFTRDEELRPGEKTKDAMERQLAQIDRDILWVEKFSQ